MTDRKFYVTKKGTLNLRIAETTPPTDDNARLLTTPLATCHAPIDHAHLR